MVEQEQGEYLNLFLEEFEEELQELNDSMIKYEEEGDEESLNQLFRSTHTIKSSAASMEFDTVSELAHKLEDVFDALRNDKIERREPLFDLLYAGIDKLEYFYSRIDEGKEVEEEDISELIGNLKKAEKGEEIEEVQREFEGKGNDSIESISVEADRLDDLMNSVGELNIMEKKLRQELDLSGDDDLRQSMDQFKRLSENIRDELMIARMVPVRQIFDRFPRVVRDLSKQTDKEIDLNIEGEDLRIDRTVLEEISDPVLHMIRNAVDHGIEPPEERERKGKARKGEINLEAKREGEEVVISVEDDGAGINVEKIVDKAIESQIISSQEANTLSRDEKLELMFNPNLSTNEQVTQVSGRGVGMNIVKKVTEELQGKYDIETEENNGTRIEMRLPISLAIVKCFIIEAGQKKFGIPINGIEHVKRLHSEDIKTIEGEEVFRYNDQELPLIDLDRRFSESEVERSGEFPVIIIYIGKRKAGVKVSSINQVEEFVIKEVGFLQSSNIAGSSILPDGTPVSILDTRNILR